MLSLNRMRDRRLTFLPQVKEKSLYGGSAGGGKSYAMLADPLRYMGNSSFSGYYYVTQQKN